jgi:7-keto-8-aminopelargonate synthetase-like enzyme
MIDCSSTAYLALDRDPAFREWVRAGFERYGTHYGGSRHAPGVPHIYAEAEPLLAAWLRTEDALLVSSGSLAATWVRQHYAGPGWAPRFAPAVHAAWNPPPAPGPAAAPVPERTPVLFADSFDPIAVATPDWPAWLAAAGPAEHWVLDESHTIGILGPTGEGLAPAYRPTLPGRLLAVGSLGKALSLPAGFIAGDRAVLDALRQSARFGGAAPPNPAFVYAFTQAGALIDRQRAALRTRLDYFLHHLPAGFPLQSVPGHPALRCLDPDFYAFAQQRGIRLSHFAYPTPTAAPVTRIVLNAGLSFPALDRLLDVIRRFANS